MKLKIALLILITCVACSSPLQQATVSSPNKTITVNFNLTEKGEPTYQVLFKNKVVIDTSFLGFEFVDAKPIKDNLEIKVFGTVEKNDPWEMPWGEQLESRK